MKPSWPTNWRGAASMCSDRSLSLYANDGIELPEGFRADLLIEGALLIELKSVERLSPLHGKQVLTYLRLLDLPRGLLVNFGGETFKEGIKRIANNHRS